MSPNLALSWVVQLRYGMVFGDGDSSVCGIYFAPSHLLPWTLIPIILFSPAMYGYIENLEVQLILSKQLLAPCLSSARFA